MDNPQATLTIEDLAWLGGLIDGEGCIYITKRVRTQSNFSLLPGVLISNTDPFIIEEVSRILHLAGIGHWVGWSNPSNRKNGRPSKRMMGNIKCGGFKRTRHALEVLIPYIRAKKDQAILVEEFCERRLRIGYAAKNSYTEIDDSYYRRVRELKLKEAPTTVRGSRVLGDKIQSEP